MPRSETASYNNNPRLKKQNVTVSFTLEQLYEYKKCLNDPIYFITNYIKIVNVDKGEILFSMWPFQKEIVKNFIDHRFNILKLPRQCGKSTTTVAYMIWQILFHESQNIAILANKYKTAQKLLSDLKKSYMALPKWLQQGVVEWNKGNIILENGCQVAAFSTSSDAIRGNAYNLIFLDEFAFVPEHISEEFFESVYPTISSGQTTKVIIVSTPKGMNKFHKMWVEATHPKTSLDPQIRWNGYVPFEIKWWEVPGRDEKWKQETIGKIGGETAFAQEFECEFIGSSNTLISGVKLNAMTWRTSVRKMEMKFSHFPDGSGGWTKHMMFIFTEPQPGRQYVLVADVAGGKELDASAFVVFDITTFPYETVASYKSDRITPMMFPDVIYQAATLYNSAFVMVETNDNDVAKTLHLELEYENLITTVNKAKGTQVGGGFTRNAEFGLRSNKSTKRIGCANLKTLVESDKLIVHDHRIYKELTEFTANSRGSYSAIEGAHDDLAMCLVNFGWLVNQRYFKEMTDSDVYSRLKEDYDTTMQDDIPFFGIITNGQSSEFDDDKVRW